jgi:uncharacterized oxidoreductase
MELTNNTILITGGTSGFGYEFASRLLALNNTVIITGRDQAKLDLTKKKLPAVHIFQSDVSKAEDITLLYKNVTMQFPQLNIIINNAGEMRKIDLQDESIDLDNIVREININLSGPIRMVQAFLPHLKTKGNGLRSYTKSLRVQLKNTGIKVFELVAPGSNTPLNDKFAGDVDEGMMMDPIKLIDVAIKGIQDDNFEIYPGIAKMIKIMSRVAPSVIFNQMSKIAEKSLAKTKA